MPDANQYSERLIKKYPNRRLYDTQTSAYITLLDVKKLVMEGISFSVADARTGEDLTRSILLQIVMEEEEAGKPLFSADMLSLMIRYYGHAMQGMMADCLETSAQAFASMQAKGSSGTTGSDEQARPASPSLQPISKIVVSPMLGGFAVEQPAELPSLNS